MKHYDFWPGTWTRIVDGEPDPAASRFVVRRGGHPASFEEDWRLVDDAGVVRLSRAIRAWDQVGQRWMFVWVSDNALFQVWEGRKVGDRWYIVREFEIDGRRLLSRQAWWPEGQDRVVRISERSFDGGATWRTRFREEYGRVTRPSPEDSPLISRAQQFRALLRDEIDPSGDHPDPSSALPESVQPSPTTKTCSASEARAFDFWIGEWDITQKILRQDGSWLALPARTSVTATLDGCALIEHWQGEVLFFWEGMKQPEPMKGLSVRAYDAESGTWSIHWMDTRSPRFGSPYVGTFAAARGEFFREWDTPQGPRVGRITFSEIGRDTVNWALAISTDGRRSWETIWTMAMRRSRAGNDR